MRGEIKIVAETEEKAIEEALERLNVEREAIDFEIEEEAEDDLLDGEDPKVVISAWIRPEYIAELAEDRLADMLDIMGATFDISSRVDDRIVRVEVEECDMASVLIGREGQTLDAIQYLVNRMVLPPGSQSPLVIVDVGGYRTRQYRELEDLVERAVERARETGNELELDSMTAIDRKYLHHYLTRFDGIKTFSRGEEPDRYLVIVAE